LLVSWVNDARRGLRQAHRVWTFAEFPKPEGNLTDVKEEGDAGIRRSFMAHFFRQKGLIWPSGVNKSPSTQEKPLHPSTPPVPKAVDKTRDKCPKAHACWAGGVRLKNRLDL
jgi:hypothetical protein